MLTATTADYFTHLGAKIMLFNVFLFIVFFCFYCCLIPTKSTVVQDSYDSFIPSVKEAFSEEFDPIPETVEEPTNPTAISL